MADSVCTRTRLVSESGAVFIHEHFTAGLASVEVSGRTLFHRVEEHAQVYQEGGGGCFQFHRHRLPLSWRYLVECVREGRHVIERRPYSDL